jgi:hypothetical protein
MDLGRLVDQQPARLRSTRNGTPAKNATCSEHRGGRPADNTRWPVSAGYALGAHPWQGSVAAKGQEAPSALSVTPWDAHAACASSIAGAARAQVVQSSMLPGLGITD